MPKISGAIPIRPVVISYVSPLAFLFGPMKKRETLTQEILKTYVHYDPDTGVFTRVSKKKNIHGRVSGYRMKHGHTQVGIGKKLYLAHRLAWLYIHGKFPKTGLDHRDGDPTNNRLSNLRIAPPRENSWNMKKPKNNKSGHKGVTWDITRNQWMAHVKKDGVRVFTKRFDQIEDAIEAVRKARILHHGEFANHG